MIQPVNLLLLTFRRALRAASFHKLMAVLPKRHPVNFLTVAIVLVIISLPVSFVLMHTAKQSGKYLNTDTLTQKHSVASNNTDKTTQASQAIDQPTNNTGQVVEDSSSTPGSDRHTTQQKSEPTSRYLVISPSTINLAGVGASCANFTVGTSDGSPLATSPTFTSIPMAFATAGNLLNYNQRAAWPATVCKIQMKSGQGSITISTHDTDGNVITGTLTVNVAFVPYFTATEGTVSQVSSNAGYGDIVTFTFPFTIEPSAAFGNPTLYFNMVEPFPSCTYGGTTSIVTDYNGQNTFALTCIMSKTQAEFASCFLVSIRGTADARDGGFSFTYTPCYKP